MVTLQIIPNDTGMEYWSKGLWKDRKTKIEEVSFMKYGGGYYKTVPYQATFIGVFDAAESIIGVNSFHQCEEGIYRSRGLFVDNRFRGHGIGKLLLTFTIQYALNNGAKMVWSFPRESSIKTYNSAGFTTSSSNSIYDEVEKRHNCYAVFYK